MIYGYARVSTQEQNLEQQLEALKKAGTEKIFKDVISGGKTSRPGFDAMVGALKKGDTVIVTRLDRLGRSLRHLIETIENMKKWEVGFRSLTNQIDTTTPSGRLVFHVFAALAEFERELIRERTNEGLSNARAHGRVGGRPTSLGEAEVEALRQAHKAGTLATDALCKTFKVSPATLFRYVKKGA